ncbi:MAG: VWA domain-containing protein [Planctomycetota bacterium]|nr:VWA domain-containing protein [Planctomycetota bacterium]
MGRIELGFQYPWFLLLLLIIPVVWWLGLKSLAGLGPWRRGIALALRTAVMLLIILAIAGVQWIWSSEKLTVIYLLDQSDSIPVAKRQLMFEYAIQSVKAHRQAERQDRAGLIVFGREAAIEIPPFDEALPNINRAESFFGKSDATNLESALKLAQASFLEDSAKRIVVLTDGNQTLGSAEATAQRLSETGIGIDVVPVRLDSKTEVLVEKIDVPGFVRQGQTVDARVVINRYCEPGSEKDIPGKLRVIRRIGNQSETLASGDYTLDRDINVIPIPHKIEETAGYTYEAEFTTDSEADDTITQNNRATAFSYARGKGKVMMIEDGSNPGNYQQFVDALRRNDIDVEVRDTRNLFSSLVELQSYDSVILAGAPRTTGDDTTQIVSFSDEQIDMLVQSAQQFGMGILMLGGPEAFGAGGWTNTKLEKAMPVNFAIKNSKVEAVGALAMVMHACEIPEGNHWQKMIGKAALEALGPSDYCGVVQYDMSGDKWLWGGTAGLLPVGPNKSMMKSRMNAMTPGDMPDFDSALTMSMRGLKTVPASLKHMIVISDGDPTPASSGILAQYTSAKIKISTVAVGSHGPAGSNELKRIANKTGGNYYVVQNASALPKIFMREARRVARPLVFEPEGGVQAVITQPHEILSGITGELPNIRGFVLTERKDSPLVEVPLRSTKPAETDTASLLATWTYGLGRTAVFTTDAGHRWADGWVNSAFYDQFFSQMVRWTMRPSNDDSKYNIATNIKDGRVQIVVTALNADDNFVNFLDMNAIAVGPDLKPIRVAMKQQASGRYVGELTPEQAGSYMLSIVPGGGKPPITTGVTMPFSDEYRVRQANMPLLESLAARTPVGGSAGTISASLEKESLKEILGLDTYRKGLPPAKSLKDVWPLAVLIGATLFFADVFVRRVALDIGLPLRMIAARLRSRSDSVKASEAEQKSRLDRLRSSKTTIGDDLEKQRASTQYEPNPDIVASVTAAEDAFGVGESKTTRSDSLPKKPSMGIEDERSYTSRLLDAKRKANKNN